MELLIAIITLFIAGICYKYRATIIEWLKDPHSLGDTKRYEVKTLMKYGVEDAGAKVRELRLKEKEQIKIAKSNNEPKAETES